MTIYELGVGDQMGNTTWLLEHDDKTAKLFEADCHKAIRNVAKDVIANVSYTVSVYDWLEATIPVLESWGYKLVTPNSIGFYSESMNCIDDKSEWREVVGDALYEKAVKAGFVHWTKSCADSDYFISVDSPKLYHRSDCPIFQKLWEWQFYTFHKESFTTERFKDYKPCPTCIGEEKL